MDRHVITHKSVVDRFMPFRQKAVCGEEAASERKNTLKTKGGQNVCGKNYVERPRSSNRDYHIKNRNSVVAAAGDRFCP